VRCAAADNAIDSSGTHGWSAWQSWTIKIGLPTVNAISFDRIAGALRCHTVKKPVRKHGHVRHVAVTRCHPRIVWRHRTVWVTVHRHGRIVRIKKTRRVRIVVPPHLVKSNRREVPYGHGTTVNGWLGTADGTALGGQTLTILTAPDNGQGRFTPAANVTTASDGSWTAALPPGPSRIVEAVYNGTSTTEGSTSGQADLVVPAKVELLRIYPRHVAWGGTIHIVGRLVGGYLPSGGALVRLRIGVGKAVTTYGVKEHVTGSGRFSTTYTFGLGDPSIHQAYWFQVASLPMGNYPYAPAASRRVSVFVGGHPQRG
jgi:hypothetical protein